LSEDDISYQNYFKFFLLTTDSWSTNLVLLEPKEAEEMIKDNLVRIVGADNVIQDQESLDKYSRDISFVNSVRPECIVKPRGAGDIQKIVELANESLTPLVPVSSGFPHFRGDTVPGLGGAIIVDLSSMKKIIRVDRRNRVVMCEPGVTFDELITAVEKEGLRLNMPLLPRKSKSVVGSMLEREPVIMPGYHWDIADPLGCVEVVFGTGDVFRTGSAAGPGTIEDQWAAGQAQSEAAGPSQASLHRVVQGAQGTMGIVTWASIRCEVLPRVEEPFLVGSRDLGKVLELVHWLIRLRLVNECFVVNNCDLASIMAREWPDSYQRLKDILPAWVLFFNIAGHEYLPEERVSYRTKDMMEIAQNVGLQPKHALAEISAYQLLDTVQRPCGEPYWKLRYKEASQDIFFITIYDKLPELIGTMYDMAREANYPSSDIGVYLQPIVQGTNCHCEFNFFYDHKDPRESVRIKGLSAAAITNLIRKGAFFSRPYGENTKAIINRDAATVNALAKVKSIFDPNNIMNPGKLCF
jgi:FAD/FMN-containing dehydrogenase